MGRLRLGLGLRLRGGRGCNPVEMGQASTSRDQGTGLTPTPVFGDFAPFWIEGYSLNNTTAQGTPLSQGGCAKSRAAYS
jgi:hypothetical protein